MIIRTLALAALLGATIAPATTFADTLHGVSIGVRRSTAPVAARAAPIIRSEHGAPYAHTYGHGYRDGYGHGIGRGHGHRARVEFTVAPVRHAPVIHVHRHGACRFIEAHHITRRVRVVVPGHHVERVVPARYEVRWQGHCYVQVLVEPRYVIREWVPLRVVVQHRRVPVRSQWVCS